MADAIFTRCPGCSTVFRVTAAQLELRDGQVRCGHCRAVFDANAQVVSLDATAAPKALEAPTQPTERRDEIPGAEAFAADGSEGLSDETASVDSADAGTAGEAISVEEPANARPADAGTAVEATSVEGPAHERPADAETAGEAIAVEATSVEGPAHERPADAGTAGEAIASEAISVEGPANERPLDTGTPVEAASVEAIADERAADAGTRLDTSASDKPADAETDEPTDAPTETAAAALGPSGFAQRSPAERFVWKQHRTTTRSSTRLYAAAGALLIIALFVQAVFEYRDALAAHVPASRPLLNAACRVFGCTIEPLRDAGALSIDASDLQADPAHRGLLLLSATLRNRSAHAIAFPYLELTLTDASDRIVARRSFPPGEYAGGGADPHRGIPANGEHVVRVFLDASATQQAGYRLYLFYP